MPLANRLRLETIGKPVYWQIPNDTRALQEARNQGVPLLTHAPRSKVQQSIAGLAQALAGKAEPPPAAVKKSRFFSFK